MFNSLFKNKAREQIEMQLTELKLNLENNYKDLAIRARKDAIAMVEHYYQVGEINERWYMKYKQILGSYTEEMKGYNHQQFYRS
ncbi:MAG: hypothetical protein ACRCW2_06555 [Cellulosilyticaceae bacterium]